MKRMGNLHRWLVLSLMVPILVACGGEAASEPTPEAVVDFATATVPADATNAPEPTAVVEPTAAVAPTATAEAVTAPTGKVPLRSDVMEFSIVNHLYYTDRERVLALTNIAGFDWVRQQIVWKDIEGPNPGDYKWHELDYIVDDVNSHNLKLLISIVQAPTFYSENNGMPDDPVALGNFVEAMMKRYGTKVQAVEIWNEQNLAHENGGRVVPEDAGRYVELLVESYKRIKAVEPTTIVLAGAPSSSGITDPTLAVADEVYFREMYRYKNGLIKDYFDVQAVHPGGSANPPETMWPDNPSNADGWTDHPTFYFRHVENVRKFMVEEGVGDHQIWITEYGWATENETPGYEFGNQVSFEEQGEYILGAMKYAYFNYREPNGEPWLGNMFLWNMNFAVLWGAQDQPLHEQASFGILNPDWSPRPGFLAVQGFMNAIKQEGRR
jgi:hypothetical protein